MSKRLCYSEESQSTVSWKEESTVKRKKEFDFKPQIEWKIKTKSKQTKPTKHLPLLQSFTVRLREGEMGQALLWLEP